MVAHNAIFDSRFLAAEFARFGRDLGPLDEHTLCTMRLTRSVLGLDARSLAECCSAVGISNQDAHSALGDADATAELFRVVHAGEASVGLAARPLSGSPGPLRIGTPICKRGDAVRPPGTWLSRIADGAGTSGDHPHASEYLAMLDTALLDRELSLAEQDQLCELAEIFGIGRAEVVALHHAYVQALAERACEDGVVTEAERAELLHVAAQLGVPPQAANDALAQPPVVTRPTTVGQFELRPGDRITLTGDMDRPRAEWMAMAAGAGLVVGPSVTKKNVLLVAADPDSMSGKARKAREYGIPIVHERAFADLLAARPVGV
ncbi:DNA polymerase III subunit epsilon [Rhodococcus hoagii]|nr:DNA polymerase III subunit epsilon [Prescottella equi]